jgi:hypothetical protein
MRKNNRGKMKKHLLLTIWILISNFSHAQNAYLKFDSDVPGIEPKVFAKDIIGRNNTYVGYCTFDNTGNEFYYAITDADWGISRILKITTKDPGKIDTLLLVDKMWEGEPFINHKGNKMFFTVINPPKNNAPWQSEFYYMEKTDTGWSIPHLMEPPINSTSSEWHVSATYDDVIYFGSEREGDRLKADIYRAVLEEGRYKKVEKLPFPVNTEYNDCDPLIAPDESWLIFHSNRLGGFGEHDLYISFRNTRNEWTQPKNMGPAINTKGWEMAPSLSPDGKYLFFTRREAFQTKTPSEIYWVDIKIIDQFKE